MYGDIPHEVRNQRLDARIEKFGGAGITVVLVFGRDRNNNILTAFMADVVWKIREFDMSTLEIEGAFFEWHTNTIEISHFHLRMLYLYLPRCIQSETNERATTMFCCPPIGGKRGTALAPE
jgi:hypothetical protein